MAEMLPLVQVVPEMNLTIDPSTGILGAAVGGAVIVSLDSINEQLDELEIAVEDFYTSLDPTTVSPGSYSGREGVYLSAGKLTNMVYGFVVGLILLVALFM
ncbi:MAG: tetrahydromethanopterin S-methyltransferase subunit B [Methanobacterium sp.]|uniref:tetrahydromethanopterin S-methyltransferase subunit MtrB n=1 Tax=Methanobacterium sp. TaxID=2164 RepID=UPI003D651853|nr:tetrahydromethanopterin S-methyltransferase subunit B [Methanobacterium sp.]